MGSDKTLKLADSVTSIKGVGKKRAELLKKMALPEKMTAEALLQVLNAIMSREEFLDGEY